jgi:hypothetical protein
MPRHEESGEPLLYNLTLIAEPNGRGGIHRRLTIMLSPDLLQRDTVIEIVSGPRRFHVIEDQPSDLTEGIFGERGAA